MKKRKTLLLVISIVAVVVIAAGILGWLFLFGASKTIDATVKNTKFHEIEVSWTESKKADNYKIVISTEKFTQSDITDKLKEDSKLGDNYRMVDVESGTKAAITDVLSNTDYYLMVIGEKSSSDVIEIHTQALEVGEINDLSVEEVTDKSIKLKWTEWTTEEKNLDGTDIEVTYTLLSVGEKGEEATEVATDISTNEYTITDLTPFTTYNYKVVVNAVVDGKVVNSKDVNAASGGSDEESEPLQIVTKTEPITGLSVTGKSTSSLSIAWNKYEKADATISYSVYGSDSESDFTLLGENITEETYTESNLAEGKTRYYYVIANITLNDTKYESAKSEIVSGTTDKKVVASTRPGNSSSGSNSKEAQARAVARQIANSITGSTDLEKITKAAQIVSEYYRRGVHKESGSDYYTAYGVFIKGEASCAGCTRALGMVLEYMGYSWKHANENQWTHQWVIVTMDGQEGYADGQVGWAGYGKHPVAQ